MKFSQKIVAASSIFLLVTISLLSFQQLSTMKIEVQGLVFNSLSEMVEGMKNSVLSEMNGKKELARATTEIVELRPLDKNYVKDVIESPTLKSSFPVVGFSYDADGIMLENSDSWEVAAGYDARERPWFIGAKSRGELVLTKPYQDAATKELIISIGTPVNHNGQFIAGMFYDFELSGLAEQVNGVNLLDAGHLFIITSDGTTIAHPDKSRNGQPLSSYLPDLTIKEGFQALKIDGVKHIVKLVKVPGDNWYVGAFVNEAIAFATISNLRTSSIIFTLVGLIISVIGLSLLIRFLMKPLSVLRVAIQGIHGDLTQRLDTNTDQEFAVLAAEFNTFIESLQKQLTQTKKTSLKIIQGTEKTKQGAQQAASALHSQLEELEQLASAMNEMAATATEVAKNAQGAASAAIQADESTELGSRVVNEATLSIDNLSARIDSAVEEIQGLETATVNIEIVLKVINDIADQTNLLALNAAIEAARAGDSGRGFAVVADEVRTLAHRTQKSTTEIRSMIEQLQAGTYSVAQVMRESKTTAVDAVSKANAANSSLQSIRDAIQSISDMNVQIASAAEEQSLVAEEINGNTLKIRDLSIQVAESAQQTESVMQEQSESVDELDVVLAKFTV